VKRDKQLARAAKMYLELVQGANSGFAWLGLWFANQADVVKSAIDNCSLSKHQYNMLHKTIVKLGHDSWRMVATHELMRAKREEDDEYASRMDPTGGNREFHMSSTDNFTDSIKKMILLRRRRVRKYKALELIGIRELDINLKKKKGDAGATCASEVELYKEVMGSNTFEHNSWVKPGFNGGTNSTVPIRNVNDVLVKRSRELVAEEHPALKRMKKKTER